MTIVEYPPSAVNPVNGPIFVLGAGRSGSTLLRLMLSSHSHISIPPETWYITPLIQRLPIDRPLTAQEVQSAIEIMTTHYRWPDVGLTGSTLREMISALHTIRLRDVLEAVYSWHLANEGKTRWGDKTPNYIAIVPSLARMFPDALFVHLVRDGRDVAKSFQRQGWSGPWLHDATRNWITALRYAARWAKTPIASRLIQVRYEDLILKPEETLRMLCEFIGEPFEPRMLAWQSSVANAVPPRERAIHPKLTAAMTPNDVARWKRELSPRELLVAESFMGSWLSQFGYELRYKSHLWIPLFTLTRIYCRLFLPVVSIYLRLVRSVKRRM